MSRRMLSLSRTFLQRCSLRALAMPVAAVDHMAISAANLHTTATVERARKATRERKRKQMLANKKKKEERLKKNPPPLPKKLVLLLRSHGIRGPVKPLRADEEEKTFPTDNVYYMMDYCYPRLSFEEALENVRCHYHPTLMNRPDELLHAKVEFNMTSAKKEKYLDEFRKMVPVIHPFDEHMRAKSICVFAKGEADKAKALEVGAFLVGGEELIPEIIKGRVEIADIDHFVCHEDMFLNMKSLSGMLRDKTPKKTDGTVGADVVKMVRTFRSGIEVHVKKVTPSLFVADQPDYGYCEAPLGKLSQEAAQLKENLDSLLLTLNENRPKREKGGFVTRVSLQMLDGPHYASFSITHENIQDEKLKEHLGGLLKKQQKKNA